jgi:thiamine biosynthesis protein ThiI
VLNGEPFAEIEQRLLTIFGIHSFSPVFTCSNDIAHIQTIAASLVQSQVTQPTRFKVVAKRADKSFPIDSQQLLQHIGGHLLRNIKGLSVDLHQPELEVHVEVRETGSYIYTQTVKGLGGFPAGSNGRAALMLSGGIDSPVAGWLALRQGLRLEAVHFHSYPYTSQQAKDKVITLGNHLTTYIREINLHMVDFTDIQLYLKQRGQENLLVTLMRRVMMRITDKIAQQTECGAIITGENLGQVASQTLPGLTASAENIQLPILRPVMMMEKQEIVDLAKRIGTFDTSILPYEDCCTLFVPKSPATNPNLRVIHAIERNLTELDQKMAMAIETKEVLILPMRAEENFADLL